jgi:uncharacterized membrane protein YfcA
MDTITILSLLGFAFTAGAIDAAVGGGGLIQIPGLMSTFPSMSTATVIGTNKVSSIFGTASAAYTFARKVKLQWKLLLVIAVCALISSFAGAACLSLIPQSVLRPFVLVMLIIIAIYTFMKKVLGKWQSIYTLPQNCWCWLLSAVWQLVFMMGFLVQEREAFLFSSLSVFWVWIFYMLQPCRKLAIL